MWNFYSSTKKLHMLLHELLASFRAKYCYLFVYLFSASLSYASTTLGMHKSSLGHAGLAEEGVPFSRPAAPHLAKLLLSLSLFLFPHLSSALLHTKMGPPAAACPIPTGLTQTSFALLLENLLFPLSDLCPEGIKSPLWLCLRGCSAPEGDKESIFIAAVEVRKSLSKAMWKLVEEFVQNWHSRLCPVGQS